jgi:RNA polymerase sigma factor (sigma-70 family)
LILDIDIEDFYNDNIGMFEHISYKTKLPEDEKLSVAYISIWNAARTFDKSKGLKFSSYLYLIFYRNCVKRYKICQPIGKGFPKEQQCFLQTTIFVDEAIKQLKESLSDSEYKILHDKFIKEKTYGEIGLELGISKQAVWEKVKKIAGKAQDAARDYIS